MSVAKQDGDLVLAMGVLARNSPVIWSTIKAELQKRVDRIRDELVSATDQVQVHQGRARESAALLLLAENCEREAAAIIAAKQQPKRP